MQAIYGHRAIFVVVVHEAEHKKIFVNNDSYLVFEIPQKLLIWYKTTTCKSRAASP